MFWQHSSASQGGSYPKPWPVTTFILMGLCLLLYSASLTGRGTEDKIQQAKDKVVCYYLRHDYLHLRSDVRKTMPKEITLHYKRTNQVMARYDSDPVTANAMGNKWRQDGDWDNTPDLSNNDEPCIKQAVNSGLFTTPPHRRLYMTLSQLSQHKRDKEQKRLDALFGQYQRTRRNHPLYGWGLIPTESRWFTLLTSIFVAPSILVLIWQLLFLYVAGSFVEWRWNGPQWWEGPVWIAVYLLAAIIVNLFLAVSLGKGTAPIIGGSVPLAAIMGMWSIPNALRTVTFAYWKPGSSVPPSLTFPGWILVGVWLLIAFLSGLIFQPYPIAIFVAQLGAFGLGAGALFILEKTRVIVVDAKPTGEPVSIIKSAALIKDTFSGAGTRTGSHRARTGSRPTQQNKPKPIDHALKAQLEQQVAAALHKGLKEEALQAYRDVIKSGKQEFWIWESMLLLGEREGLVLQSDEYLKAIRAATQHQERESARRFFSILMTHRKGQTLTLHSREQLNLAGDLKRLGLLPEAIEELEDIINHNDENAFFIKASLMKAECILQDTKNDPQKAIVALNQAEALLGAFPEFTEAVRRERQRAELRLSQQADPRTAAGTRRPQPAKVQEEELSFASSLPSSPSALPTPITTPPNVLGAASEESKEIDSSLLEEIEMFEALRKPVETEQAADSWSELPSLMLYDKPNEPEEVGEVSMFANAIKPKEKESPPLPPTDDSNLRKLSAQEKLAEEVTAAFDVSSLQSQLGWSSEEEDWTFPEDDGNATPNEEPPTPEETFQPTAFSLEQPGTPPASGGYDVDIPQLIPLDAPVPAPVSPFETRNAPLPMTNPADLIDDQPAPQKEPGGYRSSLPPSLGDSDGYKAAAPPLPGRPDSQPPTPGTPPTKKHQTRDAWASVGYPKHADFEPLGTERTPPPRTLQQEGILDLIESVVIPEDDDPSKSS